VSRFVSLVGLSWLVLAAGCSSAPTARAGASPHAERITAAEATYAQVAAAHGAGTVSLDEVCAWSARWYRAQQEAGDSAAASGHLARMKELSTTVDQAVASGMAPRRDAQAMAYFLAEAKVWASE